MGSDKIGTKSGGFFYLFDWNKKTRKKLFSNGSPEGTKLGKQVDENFLTQRPCMIDEDEIAGVSSVKGGGDYSCASSVTDEEGSGTRVPGVVARLMGLDSLPTSGVSEPHSTPLLDSQSVSNSQKRSPDFYANDQFGSARPKVDNCFRKPMGLKFQKPPSSPVERFQTEMLPPRTAKSLPITHNKLLSPIRNPGFVSVRNAAHIMEAAAKIIEPGLQNAFKGRTSVFVPSSISLKLRDAKEATVEVSQSSSRTVDSSRRPLESSDFRYLTGQTLNRSWSGLDGATVSRSSVASDEANSASAKGKGRSISLAIQAKVNVQKRGGVSTCSKSKTIQNNRDEYQANQPFKCEPSNQKNKLQKKASTTTSSSALRQNNQKQNCSTSRDRLASKQSTSNQLGRKVFTGDASLGRSKTVNKASVTKNSSVGYQKEVLETADHEREGLLSSTNFPRKKRIIEGGFRSEMSGFVENIPLDRHEKHIQPNIIIDEQLCRTQDGRRNGTDVVSFTFTSPMVKSIPGNHLSTHVAEDLGKRNGHLFNSQSENFELNVNDKKISSLGSNAISGDALSLLLEQKLRELTVGLEPSYSNIVHTSSLATRAPVLGKPFAFSNDGVTLADHTNKFAAKISKDNLVPILEACHSLSYDGAGGMSFKMQGVDEVECSSSGTQKEHDHQNPSPLSILEASFSNESYNSSESFGSSEGSKMCSSVQAQNIVSLNAENKIPSVKVDVELSDSASSLFKDTLTDGPSGIKSTGHLKRSLHDLEYLKEIIFSTGSLLKDLGSCHVAHSGEALDPLLFDNLENKRRKPTPECEDKESRLRRKVLFDSVNECLDLKCSRFFRAGYHSWAKGVAVVGKDLAIELHEEISGWKSMGDWMVDELVDKDMSSHLGRWVDFEIDAFEAGVDFEKQILGSLVDELVADLFPKGPRL